jgi:hypothetical protein
MYMVTTSLMKILNFFGIFWILKFFEFWKKIKFCENFEILNFKILFYFIFEFLNFLKFSEFSLIDDEVQVFRINIKLLSNLVAELKIHESDSHCRSIVLKIMDRSIVKQLEKEKNSNFNVENCVVMFIYWCTINPDIALHISDYYI